MATLAGVTPGQLSAILHRRIAAGGRLAVRLRNATRALDCEIPLEVWLENLTTEHPAFFGKAKRRPCGEK